MAAGCEVAGVKLWLVIEEITLPAPAAAGLLHNLGSTIDPFTRIGFFGSLGVIRKPVLDVQKFAASFGVNSIPQATASIAIGRRADNVDVLSELHELRDFLQQRLRVSVYAQLRITDVTGGIGMPWSGNPFRVFDGYTAGCGYQRTEQGASFSLQLVHWLDDLTKSSSISAITHPQNPAALDFPATFILGTPGVPGAFTAANTGQQGAGSILDGVTLNTDFWGRSTQFGLQAFLISLTTRDFIRSSVLAAEMSRDPQFHENRTNLSARLALERFENTASRVQSVPLRFRTAEMSAGAPQPLMDGIHTWISENLNRVSVLAGQTLWDVLLNVCGQFGIAVIPMVEKALVVPFVRGLRAVNTTISSEDYSYISHMRGPAQIIRGVAVYGGTTALTGNPTQVPNNGGPNNNPQHSAVGVGGWYQGDSQGQVRWFQAPAWAVGPFIPQSAALTLAGRANAFNPQQLMTPVQIANLLTGPIGRGTDQLDMLLAANVANNLPDALRTARNTMDRLAHLLYVNEVIGHRQGDLGGRLTFLIGPGSSIKIEGIGDKFIANNQVLGGDLYATVLQVNFQFDAESPAASTSFHVSHLRSQRENERDATSIDEHPLWQDNWLGCPLLERT